MQGCFRPARNPARLFTGRLTDALVRIFLGLSLVLMMLFPAVSKAQQKVEKYHLGPQLIPGNFTPQKSISPGSSMPMYDPYTGNLNTSCPNSNFNLGNFNDWTGCYGTFTTPAFPPNAPGVLQPCITQGYAQHWPSPGRRHIIEIAPGYLDPYSCDSIITVFPGEAFSARLGDTSGGGHAEQLKYNVNISSDNYLFIYRYAVVLESPNHITTQQPGFTIQVQDLNGNLIDSCGYFSFTAPTCNNPPNCPNVAGWNYCAGVGYQADGCYSKNWTTVGMDLSTYASLGTVRIVFTSRGCSHTAHRGYAYISAYCSALLIQTALCQGDTSATLTAPPGFAHYLWSTGDTTQSITILNPVTNSSYSVLLTAVNGCTVTLTNTLTYTIITTDFTNGPSCQNQPTQFTDLSIVSQNSVVNWKWNFGDGSPDLNGVQNPTHTYTNTGTYTIKLVSYSTEGCKDSITHQLTVSPMPTAAISGTTAVCLNSTPPLVTFTGADATAPYTFTYKIDGGANQIVTTTNGNSVTVAAPTNVVGTFIYSLVSVQEGSTSGCTQPATGSATITVKPMPTAAISGTTTV